MKTKITILMIVVALGLFLSAPVFAQIGVTQNYVNVQIQNFKVESGPDNTIAKDQAANVTCTLINTSDFAGTVSAGVAVPSSISYSVFAAGGEQLYLQAGESQSFTLTLTNNGNLAVDSGPITLTLTITNTNGDVTDQRSFELNFKAGLIDTPSPTAVAPTNADTISSPPDWALIGAIIVIVVLSLGLLHFALKSSQRKT